MLMNANNIMEFKMVKQPDQLATGENARKFRKEQGLSLKRVADRMGITSAYLSDLERGRRNWNEKIILEFCRAMSEE